ncbi:MAG TPA: polysaccharide deacetylase family protein, partial [bacterium]|nr:polysaccharide deacetylase family protein [bacterium]
MRRFLFPLVLLLPLQAFGAQPPVAKFTGGFGLAKLGSPEGFDALSRLEILAYVRVVAAHQDLTDTARLQTYLGRQQVNPQSVAQWMGLTQARLLGNFAQASAHCGPTGPACPPTPADWAALTSTAATMDPLPPSNAGWKAAMNAFSEAYFREQVRLAALFPAITDEALKLDPGEKDGWDLPDKTFMLTFDDGPTPPGGNTDKTLAMLKEQRLPGMFFVLGEQLQQRLALGSPEALRTLYSSQSVSAHGWTHTSHAKRPDWKESIARTRALIHSTFPGLS